MFERDDHEDQCSEGVGVGGVGQAFVDAVRAQAAGRTVGVYAVNYPAADNFSDRTAFAGTVVAEYARGVLSAATAAQSTSAR